MGLLKTYEIRCKCNVITLSATARFHTSMNRLRLSEPDDNEWTDLRLHLNNTIVGKSIDTSNDKSTTSTIDEMIDLAKRADDEFGLMRTLLLRDSWRILQH